jgi:hypothetical protein
VGDQIWTDVDGMVTSTRTVPGARTIPEVRFQEAAELAYFGAKVLHPATIKPAIERGIPVRILNSLNPAATGTTITADAEWTGPRAIAFKRGITVVLISQPRMLMAHGFLSRLFAVFEKHRTSVDLIATSEVSVSLTVDEVSSLAAIRDELAALGDVEVRQQMAIVSVVGRGFTRRSGLAARIFSALSDVNVVMISFGASDVNVSFVVAEAEAEGRPVLHRALRRLTHAVAIVGYGRMGREVEAVLRERGHEAVVAARGGFPPGCAVGIDFTRGPAVPDNVARALSGGARYVVGTTGWSDRHDDVRRSVESARGGLVHAANFSWA